MREPAEPGGTTALHDALHDPAWTLPLREDLVARVHSGVRTRRRHRLAARWAGAAAVLATVSTALLLPGPAAGPQVPAPPGRSETAPAAERPLGGWTLGWLPPGYRALSRDSRSTSTAGPEGLRDDGAPAGPGAFEVVVDMRRLTDQPQDVTDLVVTVLGPRLRPGVPAGVATAEARLLFEAQTSGAGTPVPVPGVAAGEAVLVPDGSGSGDVVVLAGTGDVITVSGVRLGDDDLVRIARGLRR